MATYERAQVSTLLDRLDETPERLIVVTGPRQMGKTTLVRQALGRIGRSHHYLPADEPEPVTPPPFPCVGEGAFAFSNGATIPIAGEKGARGLVRFDAAFAQFHHPTSLRVGLCASCPTGRWISSIEYNLLI